jgi:hypothetical protein
MPREKKPLIPGSSATCCAANAEVLVIATIATIIILGNKLIGIILLLGLHNAFIEFYHLFTV